MAADSSKGSATVKPLALLVDTYISGVVGGEMAGFHHVHTTVFLYFMVAGALCSVPNAVAQVGSGHSENQELSANNRPWQVGFFVQGGFPPSYRVFYPDGVDLYYHEDLQLYSAGLIAGKQTRWTDGPRLLRGRGEVLFEVMPFWLGRYPPQNLTLDYKGQPILEGPTPGKNYFGASITPLLLRWNFSNRTPGRIIPWTQLGGGVLWTTHKFPQSISGTSVFNFTPQVGIGANVLTRPRQSVNFAMKAIHISNAGLGDHNPGLNVTLQFSAGYSWWH